MATPKANTLSIRNIRCFENERLELRPLTVLLGENSSGKTTALACHQAQFGSLGRAIGLRNGNNPFNQRPHAMGLFKQIARTAGVNQRNVGSADPNVALTQTVGDLVIESRFHEHSDASIEFNSLTLSNRNKKFQDEIVIRFNGKEKSTLGKNADPGSITVNVPRTGLRIHDMASFLKIYLPSLISKNPYNLSSSTIKKQLKSLDRFLKLMPDLKLMAMGVGGFPAQRRYTNEDLPRNGIFRLFQSLLNSNVKTHSKVWERLRKSAKRFGEQNGLYNDMDLKFNRIGRKSFQVFVNRDGREINICDMGMGAWPMILRVMEIEHQSIIKQRTVFHIQHPENDAHPKLQTELISFICKKIKDGHHFIIETHSDFILRRLGIEISDKKISADDVSVAYFDHVREKNASQIHNLKFSNTGVVLKQPECYRRFQYAESDRYVWAVNRE